LRKFLGFCIGPARDDEGGKSAEDRFAGTRVCRDAAHKTMHVLGQLTIDEPDI
jgi:hypothetical protein